MKGLLVWAMAGFLLAGCPEQQESPSEDPPKENEAPKEVSAVDSAAKEGKNPDVSPQPAKREMAQKRGRRSRALPNTNTPSRDFDCVPGDIHPIDLVGLNPAEAKEKLAAFDGPRRHVILNESHLCDPELQEALLNGAQRLKVNVLGQFNESVGLPCLVRLAPALCEIAGNQFTDKVLEIAPRFPRLTVLDLAGSDITDSGMKHVTGLKALKVFVVRRCKVTDAGLSHLSGLENLEVIGLVMTRITGAGLVHLRGLRRLRKLDLEWTKVNDVGLAHLSGLVNLERLELRVAKITDAGIAHLGQLKKLEVLDLSWTPVTDVAMVHLTGLSQLRELHLANTKITDVGLGQLSKLAELKSINLYETNVTDDAVATLKKALPGCNVER